MPFFTLSGGVFCLLFFELQFEVLFWLFLTWISGLCYILGELPNSFFKRKFGIAEGESNTITRIIDQYDSVIAICLCYYLLDLPSSTFVPFGIFCPPLFWITKIFLNFLNLKKSRY